MLRMADVILLKWKHGDSIDSGFLFWILKSEAKDVFPRPGSDALLFMSRTKFEFGPTQINKSTPVDSDELAVPQHS